MSARIDNPFKHAPASMKAASALEQTLTKPSLDERLFGLVRMRASQINGCAYCIQMHMNELEKLGESTKRMLLLDGWREATIYSDRERAALGWTEALTRIADTHAPDAAYDALKAEFSEDEQVTLSLVIGTINMWNRLQIGFRVPPA